MIIGVDESGNFSSDSLSFYAAIFIRPKRYIKLQRKFIAWETALPSSVKENGEVKGKLLSNEQLIEFAKSILIDNGYGAVKTQVFGIEINEANSRTLEYQQAHNVAQLRTAAKEVYRDQGKEYTQIASFYEQMADWLKSKSLKTLYKIEVLGVTIVKSMNLAIISSTLRGFDKELGKLEINIDQGITGRASVDRYWRDTMRTIFWHLTSSVEPLIHITEWKPNHPFLQRFVQYPKSRERLSLFTHDVRDMFQFYDSKDRFEIRIADIVASAYFRHYERGEPLNEAVRLIATQRVQFGSPYIKIILNNFKNPNPINPYTDRIEGITVTEIKEKYGGQ